MRNLFFIFLLFQLSAFSQESVLTQEEKESSIIDYSSIRKVLENDGLEKQRQKREKYVKTIKEEKIKIQKNRSRYPEKDDFFLLMTELWLVRNAQVLRWDFPKPEYGVTTAFRNLLEKYGYYNVSFKLLIVNSPTITHFGFPAGENSYIFLLSLPFIRSLDLTKVDLSLLLLEDYLRVKNGLFVENIKLDLSKLGSEVTSNNTKNNLVTKAMKGYSNIVFETGFNFQQQYQITKDMDQLLKSTPQLWGAYFNLYKKIDRFIKTDLLYKNLLKIYPSPELQIQWLSPKKKVI
ncbi:MAG: hypothetical protein OEW87_15550 [Flavobacteriaceae bacterium]|nr:hypothetical protein [Flavobacteriaceae bacterium]